jgi:starch phosphorylase
MKLALNGALTIGTDDGANIEIRQNVGDDNIFIFGLKTAEVEASRHNGYDPMGLVNARPTMKAALDAIAGGTFSADEPARYAPLIDSLRYYDHYRLLADFESYVEAQGSVDALYRDPHAWAFKAIANVAGMGPFSSDRTIGEYASRIWQVQGKA